MTDEAINQIQLNFNADSQWVLNVAIGLIMFGVALNLKPADFRQALSFPRAMLAGLASQFLILPAATCLLITVLEPSPSLALGMLLVSACPGGNVSNFMTHLARGNAALSVSMSAVSTAAAIVMTPLNFAFWGELQPITREAMQQISISPLEVFKTILLILLVPMALGLLVAYRWPNVAAKAKSPMKIFSIVFFLLLIVLAFGANLENFSQYIYLVFWLVLVHNILALGLGYGTGWLLRLQAPERRAVTIETGIQNSGLGLLLIFQFFSGLGGMALIAGWWGIWHIVSGLTVATIWSRIDPEQH